MSFPKIEKKELLEKLQAVGVQKGNIIYVASFMSILGNDPYIVDDTIDSLIESVGKEGTVVMPAFNWDYCSSLF